MADWMSILGALASTGGGAAQGAYNARIKQNEEERKKSEFQEMIRQFNQNYGLQSELGRGHLANEGRGIDISDKRANTEGRLADETITAGGFNRGVEFPWRQQEATANRDLDRWKVGEERGGALDVAKEHSRGQMGSADITGRYSLQGDALRAATQIGITGNDRKQGMFDKDVQSYREGARKALEANPNFASPEEKQAAWEKMQPDIENYTRESAVRHGAKVSTDPITGKDAYNFPDRYDMKGLGSFFGKGQNPLIDRDAAGGEGASPSDAGAPPGSGGRSLRDALGGRGPAAPQTGRVRAGFRRPF